jgi:hypothetical protein
MNIFALCVLGLSSLALFAADGSTAYANGPEKDYLLRVFQYNPHVLQKAKIALKQGKNDAILQASLQGLIEKADGLLTAVPGSVVEKTQLPPGGDIHDYLSLAPYWWPDPTKPDGLPYIQKDGQTNPEVNSIPDKGYFGKMTTAVSTLGFAYYFTNDEKYAAKATEFLRVWFLNADTYMNPNLEHAQMIKGRDTGRGIGIIDVRGFTDVIDGISCIEKSYAFTNTDQQGLKSWFTKYLDWLLHSKNGTDEAATANNHGTWYDLQAASIALYLNDTGTAHSLIEGVKTKRMDPQIMGDGSQPQELSRTLSWHYSVFNLQPLVLLAYMGEHVHVNLWDYQTPAGGSILKALDFVRPAAFDPKIWPYKQISPLKPGELIDTLHQAAIHYQNATYWQEVQTLMGAGAGTSINNLLYGDHIN